MLAIGPDSCYVGLRIVPASPSKSVRLLLAATAASARPWWARLPLARRSRSSAPEAGRARGGARAGERALDRARQVLEAGRPARRPGRDASQSRGHRRRGARPDPGQARDRGGSPRRPSRATRPLAEGPFQAPRRDLQVGSARRAHGHPRLRRLRRPRQPLRLPRPHPGPGRGHRRTGSAIFATRPRTSSARSARLATRSPPRRRSSSARASSSRRARPSSRRFATRRPRRSTRRESRRTTSRGDLSDLNAQIQEQLWPRLKARPRLPTRFPPDPIQGASGGFIWPVNGPVVSPFGPRWGRLHAGIDIAVPSGTPIRAVKDGNIVLGPVRGLERRLRQLHLHRPRRRALQLLRPPVGPADHLRIRLPGRRDRPRRLHRQLLRRPPPLRDPRQRRSDGPARLPLSGTYV